MLLVTSFFGSIIGFFACYKIVAKMHHVNKSLQMRICMLNSMSLAFIFAMLIELTTGSKSLAIIIPVATVCLPMVLMMKPFSVLDMTESCIATLMSVSMSVMLIGMIDSTVIWVIQCVLVAIEVMLYLTVVRRAQFR
ncbi:hypothetical protein [Ferroacidibacillus organovorans]|uniref:Uncharacterized protein n=1 Tax=Ferroacidibacillus organovorans TaxID=1765683 RepID=A0A853KED8_9BACL|nr:hypothetical protein [Ferroacidibacillus organovorans]KYP79933.1 hypothetical protein AYJ22_03280 [Ferroacidibacillus organovorans]OAG94589.1 hypothetical protein AYW79_04335 [Ferroacidibacillus organovorans]